MIGSGSISKLANWFVAVAKQVEMIICGVARSPDMYYILFALAGITVPTLFISLECGSEPSCV